jgi:hypothetical protein
MRSTIGSFLWIPFCFIACQSPEGYKKAEDAQEAAREFIQATLEGNEPKALFYLYKDPSDNNLMLLREWKKSYDRLAAEEKTNYQSASIIVAGSKTVNDSVVQFTYSNSFKKQKTTLKIVRKNGEWLVDFKDFISYND